MAMLLEQPLQHGAVEPGEDCGVGEELQGLHGDCRFWILDFRLGREW
jgi:hypothetical protein